MAVFEDAADAERFEEICSEYRDYMYCVAFCILKDREAAEDVVQKAFEHIAVNLDWYHSDDEMLLKDKVACLVARGANGVWTKTVVG